jgi:hypothetical protein
MPRVSVVCRQGNAKQVAVSHRSRRSGPALLKRHHTAARPNYVV